MHGDKTRAKALDAGKVLVAVRLVDPPLATEFGFQRLHRDAVGNGRAVAAAFADALIDEDALRRIRIEPALAAATLFRRAGLVVDQDGEALDLAQFLLHRVEFAAVMNGRAYWEVIAGIFFGIVRDDGEAFCPFRRHLVRDLRHGQATLGRLAAGHRHRIIVEDLVGDVDAGSRRGTDRQQAGMGVGAIAKILEHVRLAGERRLPDPGDAFRAHVRDRLGAAVRHRQRHAVTADAGHGAAALGDLGRGVMRAARAEIRRPLQLCRANAFRRPVERLEFCQTLFQRRAAMAQSAQPRHDGCRHHGWRQLTFAR